jgi:hypothetical protein
MTPTTLWVLLGSLAVAIGAAAWVTARRDIRTLGLARQLRDLKVHGRGAVSARREAPSEDSSRSRREKQLEPLETK